MSKPNTESNLRLKGTGEKNPQKTGHEQPEQDLKTQRDAHEEDLDSKEVEAKRKDNKKRRKTDQLQ